MMVLMGSKNRCSSLMQLSGILSNPTVKVPKRLAQCPNATMNFSLSIWKVLVIDHRVLVNAPPIITRNRCLSLVKS